MTPFAAWRQRLGLSQREAAASLAVSLPTYQSWEHEFSRRTNSPTRPPHTALLAAAAIESGIAPIR